MYLSYSSLRDRSLKSNDVILISSRRPEFCLQFSIVVDAHHFRPRVVLRVQGCGYLIRNP
jgi:hypothetical protein